MFLGQKQRPSFPDPSFRSSQNDGFRSPLLPLPLSLSLLDAERLVARENGRGGSDRARRGASDCRIGGGRFSKLGEWFLQMMSICMKKMACSKVKGSMSLRAGSERLEHRLLEPTYSASSPGATAAACGTLEYSAALRNAICGVRAPPQTSALGCP